MLKDKTGKAPANKDIKFVDQTSETIDLLQNGRPAIPGTSVFSSKPKRRKTEQTVSPSDNYEQMLNMPLIFTQEMCSLIRSPGAYGLPGLEEPSVDKNFDFYDEEFDKQNTEGAGSGAGSSDGTKGYQVPRITGEGNNVTSPYNDQNEFWLIMYFTRTMCQFYSLKSPDWTIYAYMGGRLASQYLPLKYAILSWTALHYASVNGSSKDVAQQYYNEALNVVMREEFIGGKVHVELLLTTCFFLLQFDIAMGTRQAKRILRHVWSKLQIGRFFGDIDQSSRPQLSPYGYQILYFILHIDIRSSLFTGNISFPDYVIIPKNQRNVNIEYLTTSKLYDDKASDIAWQTRGVSSDIFGKDYPKSFTDDDSLLDHILVTTMRNIMTLGRVIRLRNWLDQCGNSTEFDPESFQQEVDELVSENEQLYETFKSTKMSGRNVQSSMLICNALVYCAVILLDRQIHPNIKSNERSQDAAKEIIKIAVKLNTIRDSQYPRSQLWPFPLLIAGIETTDPIYQAWVLDAFKEYSTKGWGIHITKAVRLLEECLRKQGEEDVRVDVGEVMMNVTGVFII